MSPTNSGLTLILASTSRYRRELLERLKIPFLVASPNTDETTFPNEQPWETAQRLALAKARSIQGAYPRSLIIGSDQVATCNGVRLDKPGNYSSAVAQLRVASGNLVNFITAIALLNTETHRVQTMTVSTDVKFRVLGDGEIERYVHAEPAYDCAGSAKAEALGISLLESLQSTDPSALIGLPLIALCTMLRNEGLHVP